MEQQVTLRGQSKSTLHNYIRRIALFVIHFGKLPELIDPDEINEFLAGLARDPRSPSRSSFKHMVYGLRYYYRLLGLNKNLIALYPLDQLHIEKPEVFSMVLIPRLYLPFSPAITAGFDGMSENRA